MRVLFLPLITRGSAIGTISRCLAVAAKLREAGHEAFFLTNSEGMIHVNEAGYAHALGALPDTPGPIGHPLMSLADVAVYLNLTREDYIRRALAAEAEAVERFKPDVLFSEFKLTAPMTAARCGLPLVSTACSPADPRFTAPLFAKERGMDGDGGLAPRTSGALSAFNKVLAELGQAPVTSVGELFFGRSRRKIAPTARALEPLLADVPDLTYVGYLLYDSWERAPLPPEIPALIGRRKPVYVYLGMGHPGPKEYLRILPEAFDDSEFFAVIATGDHPDLPATLPRTPGTACFRFVPAGSMLAVASVLIFHGGQNTAMASLLHGAPSLIFPGYEFERDFNARGLEAVGAGVRLPPEAFTAKEILDRCREMGDGDRSRAAAAMGRELAALGGPAKAAELIVETARDAGAAEPG